MIRRVLVADDSALVRLTLTRRVRAAGVEVIERDSVASMRDFDPHTITRALLDFDLGDGFGTTIAGDLRRVAPELPIAFFTSEVISGELHGPVFKKPEQLDLAIAWLLDA